MLYGLLALFLTAVASSCSTTRRLGPDDILYTGVKKIDYQVADTVSLPGSLTSDIFDVVNVKPNNALYSPYVRWPFPLGLWVYNNWTNPPKGLRHWLYEKLVSEPVLISDVRPEVRVHMIDQMLDNNGFFRGRASYELVKGKNPKKARILYKVDPGEAYPIDTVELLPDTCALYHAIDSIAMRQHYLKAGSRYCVDSLA